MKPPSGGPTIGPISAGMISHDIADTISCLATERSSTSRPTGIIIAPPIPCTKRATTISSSEGERPQASDPVMKIRIAVRKMVRDPKRSASVPEAGMKIARARR